MESKYHSYEQKEAFQEEVLQMLSANHNNNNNNSTQIQKQRREDRCKKRRILREWDDLHISKWVRDFQSHILEISMFSEVWVSIQVPTLFYQRLKNHHTNRLYLWGVGFP
jgi:hypothetical protein